MSEAINRYDRQERIEGWDQDKLTKSSVGIVGSGHSGNFLAASFASLGVGDVRLYDKVAADPESKDGFLLAQSNGSGNRVEKLEHVVSRINPLVNVLGFNMDYDTVAARYLDGLDVLVIATNNLLDVAKYYTYAESKDLKTYVIRGDEQGSSFTDYLKDEDLSNDVGNEDGITSEVITGLLSGEVVNHLMGRNSISNLKYDLRTKFAKDHQLQLASLESKSALLVGAGASGNFAGIGLGYSGIGKLYIADDDTIETTNLNRQILFYDSVGKHKAEVLGDRIKRINPNANIEAIIGRVTENFEDELQKINPDVILDCVDNHATRAILNHFAIKYHIPLISGGTDPKAGQVTTYVPGQTACLNCRWSVDEALAKARTSRSCIYSPNPSVVITNHIVGGVMASEIRSVLDPKNYGMFEKKMIKYDSSRPTRIGVAGAYSPCDCVRKVKATSFVKRVVRDFKKKNKNQTRNPRTPETDQARPASRADQIPRASRSSAEAQETGSPPEAEVDSLAEGQNLNENENLVQEQKQNESYKPSPSPDPDDAQVDPNAEVFHGSLRQRLGMSDEGNSAAASISDLNLTSDYNERVEKLNTFLKQREERDRRLSQPAHPSLGDIVGQRPERSNNVWDGVLPDPDDTKWVSWFD
ncbi:hypothetical protein GOV14_02420 [Candidatus Pacearchaeota archaeon]|nr:hypothetical protein [Candidatus Pacearchaeota archaeon]